MSTEFAQLPFPDRSSGADPARFAASQHDVFHGQNLTVGASSVVHGIEWMGWLGTLTLPVPACRQAYGGPGTRGELRPTRWPVTCLRCRRAAGEPTVFLHEHPDQLALFPLPQQRTTAISSAATDTYVLVQALAQQGSVVSLGSNERRQSNMSACGSLGESALIVGRPDTSPHEPFYTTALGWVG